MDFLESGNTIYLDVCVSNTWEGKLKNDVYYFYTTIKLLKDLFVFGIGAI